MDLLSWWEARNERREKRAKLIANLALNNDQDAIAANVPELLGMTDVEGMAYLLRQIEAWNEYATPEHALALAGRLKKSNDAWAAEGNTMPYWGSLWVLRNLQRELGIDAPEVAPAIEGN